MSAKLEAQKKQAALKALELVKSGMQIGIGTGSTAKYFIEGLAEKINSGELTDIKGVATSRASEELAIALGIPVTELIGQTLDIAVDGMDEVDMNLNAIKGLGGALTREKIVEACASKLVLIGDETKRVAYLGQRAPIPVEVVAFGWKATQKRLVSLGCRPVLRQVEGEAFLTDNHNVILDCYQEEPIDADLFAEAVSIMPGVVEHGLFLWMASVAFIATEDGVIELRAERS